MAEQISVRENAANSDYLLISGIAPHEILCWKQDALRLRTAISEAFAIYQHSDPCGDEACPCRKAEADGWRDHGAVRY